MTACPKCGEPEVHWCHCGARWTDTDAIKNSDGRLPHIDVDDIPTPKIEPSKLGFSVTFVPVEQSELARLRAADEYLSHLESETCPGWWEKGDELRSKYLQISNLKGGDAT